MDHKSFGGCSYLRLFFDLIDIFVVNLRRVYKVFYPKRMKLLDFKIVLAKLLLGTCNSRSRNTPVSHVSHREVLPASVPLHVPVLQTTGGKRRYCYIVGIENKTYIQCNACVVFLCLIPVIDLETLLKISILTFKDNKHLFCCHSIISSFSFTLGYLAVFCSFESIMH